MRAFAGLRARYVPKNSFVEGVLVLLTGTLAAQVIPIVVSPILTRLYTPREFGVYAEYMSLAAVLALLGTARYDLAVMLPRDDRESVNVAALTVVLSLAAGVVTLSAFALFNDRWTALLGTREISPWLSWVPALTVSAGVYQALSYWSNRHRAYGRLAVSDITLRGASEGAKWCLGLGGVRWLAGNGLIVGTVAGQALATAVLGWQVWRRDDVKLADVNLRAVAAAGSRYRRFPTFSLPYSLLGTLGAEFTIFALTAYQQLHVAGFLGLTRRIVLGPISLLATSLGRVFFKETVVSIGTPRFERLLLTLMRTIAEVFTPAFVLFAFWAPALFAWVFGEEWREAGWYAAVLVPVALCSLFTTWPERVFEVRQRQHISLSIQAVFDAVRIAAVWGLLHEGTSPLVVIAVYSGLSCLYHSAYLRAIFVVAELPVAGFYLLGRKVGVLAVASLAVAAGIRLAVPTVAVQLLLSGGAAALYYALVVPRVLDGTGRRVLGS